jgi:hypothetical protein
VDLSAVVLNLPFTVKEDAEVSTTRIFLPEPDIIPTPSAHMNHVVTYLNNVCSENNIF